MGQSLTKIAYIEEESELVLSLFSTKAHLKEIEEFLEAKKNTYKKYNFTGGRAFNFHVKFSNGIESNLLNEFQSSVKGLETLYFLSKGKTLPDSLIITIGTGTSIILKKETFTHIGGTAMGGGLFMGFIKLLFYLNDFQKALKLAKKGNRYNIDLKVSDIYDPKDFRIDLVFREFTAASFGKIEDVINLDSIQKEDIINSLICLIGENIAIIARLMADNNNVHNLFFCGGFLKENVVLKNILSAICRMNKKKAIFLKNSEYCGAIGALLS